MIIIYQTRSSDHIDRINELGTYARRIAKISINHPVYEILIPQNITHIEKFVEKIGEEIVNFGNKWQPRIINISNAMYRNERSRDEKFKYHINKDMTIVSIYNEVNWTETAMENMVDDIMDELREDNRTITMETWQNLSQQYTFNAPKKWANIKSTRLSDIRDNGRNHQPYPFHGALDSNRPYPHE